MLRKKDLLGLKDLTREELEDVLAHAAVMKESFLSRAAQQPARQVRDHAFL